MQYVAQILIQAENVENSVALTELNLTQMQVERFMYEIFSVQIFSIAIVTSQANVAKI